MRWPTLLHTRWHATVELPDLRLMKKAGEEERLNGSQG